MFYPVFQDISKYVAINQTTNDQEDIFYDEKGSLICVYTYLFFEKIDLFISHILYHYCTLCSEIRKFTSRQTTQEIRKMSPVHHKIYGPAPGNDHKQGQSNKP